jgi:methionyl-tRNA formyltransferase
MHDFKVLLLAYPDNPIGPIFLKTFLKSQLLVSGIIVEQKNGTHNWSRLKKKVEKDGLLTAIKRTLHIFILKILKKNIVGVAEKKGIPIHWVKKFNSPACAELLASLNADILAIVSAPILKDTIFTKAKKGCLNAHPGWLPKYRGLGANAYSLQNGDAPAVSVHFIDSGIDTGQIIIREKIAIQAKDTVAKINDRAMVQGAQLMATIIRKIKNDQLVMPMIHEAQGKLYKAMPYAEVKKVNARLQDYYPQYNYFHKILSKISGIKPDMAKAVRPVIIDKKTVR